ncbi:MAG: Na/Pi cotransporter family protein [Bacillota bacterium]
MLINLLLVAIALAGFLLGMRLMAGAMRDLAGARMQQVLTLATDNPWRGCLVGALVTAILQSSSATTAMVVAAVEGGLLGLEQALGLIAGANIGTTVTAQLAALQLYQLILPLLGGGLLLFLLPRQRPLSRLLLGLGLLFWGLQGMSESLLPLVQLDLVDSLLRACSHSVLLGVLFGTLLTAVVQSSSAVTGVVIGLAISDSIDLSAAMAIALGSNIGTCVTALLAAWGGGQRARQAAYGHLWFNVIGVLAVLPVYDGFLQLVTASAPDLPLRLANGHMIFNVLSALVFLLLLPLLRRSVLIRV